MIQVTNRKRSRAVALATTITTALSAVPASAHVTTNKWSQATIPSLSILLGNVKHHDDPSKQELSHFETSADMVDTEIKVDFGAVARETGGEIIGSASANVYNGFVQMDPAQGESINGLPHVQSSDSLNTFLNCLVDRRLRNQNYSEYGMSVEDIKTISKAITCEVISDKFNWEAGLDSKSVATKIQNSVNGVLRSLGHTEISPSLRERLLFQAAYDFTRTHLSYNLFLTTAAGMARPIASQFWYSKDLYKMPSPFAVCPGYANITVDISKELGLNCFAVNGFTRPGLDSKHLPSDLSPESKPPHKWVILVQSDGLLLPCDPSNGSVSLALARQSKGDIDEPACFPLTSTDWAIHAAVYYPTQDNRTWKALEPTNSTLRVSFSEWRNLNVTHLATDGFLPMAGKSRFRSATVNIEVQ